jgi:TDG/mug DNA glycosylase family protein
VGFTKTELETYRDVTVPDLIGTDCRLLFVGINPGLWTAATQTHFCHPSNRFYPTLRRIGLIDWAVDTDTGMTDQQRDDLVVTGIGITNLVARATPRASELSREELRAGADRLRDTVDAVSPMVVAVAGVTAYREAFGDRTAGLGRQGDLGPAKLWVVPNPSGLTAHETIDSLAKWYEAVARAAGILDQERSR